MMKRKIEIVIADDQNLFADNLRMVLESRAKDIRVIDIAYNGREAVEIAEKVMPHVILMDVRMPIMDGVEAVLRIKKKKIDTKIIMLTTFDDDKYVYEALANGAVGYILKNSSANELISSIRAVYNGSILLSPKIMNNIICPPPKNNLNRSSYRKNLTDCDQEKIKIIDELTAREMQIVKLISLAYDNKKISAKLGIAEQTVKNYISKIFIKIGISKRTQLMRIYTSWNSIQEDIE